MSHGCFYWLYGASPSLAAKNIINLISVLAIWWCLCVESSLVLLEDSVCYDHLGKTLLASVLLHSVLQAQSESEVAQSCPTFCDPMDWSLPGSSVHRIFQAIVLEWIAISFSRGSSQPRDQTRVSHIVDRRFTIWATREAFGSSYCYFIFSCISR